MKRPTARRPQTWFPLRGGSGRVQLFPAIPTVFRPFPLSSGHSRCLPAIPAVFRPFPLSSGHSRCGRRRPASREGRLTRTRSRRPSEAGFSRNRDYQDWNGSVMETAPSRRITKPKYPDPDVSRAQTGYAMGLARTCIGPITCRGPRDRTHAASPDGTETGRQMPALKPQSTEEMSASVW